MTTITSTHLLNHVELFHRPGDREIAVQFFEALRWTVVDVTELRLPYPAVAFGTAGTTLASRGDDYRRYQRETSVFVPWFPRKAAA